jgi:hypothetical protein
VETPPLRQDLPVLAQAVARVVAPWWLLPAPVVVEREPLGRVVRKVVRDPPRRLRSDTL